MIRTFEVQNVACQKCANTIKNALEDDFGNIEVDLNFDPKRISLELKEEDIDKLEESLFDIGFPLIHEVK